MESKVKVLMLVLLLAFLNVTFMLGQIFYYKQATASILARTPRSWDQSLSITLFKAIHKKFSLVIDDKELAVDVEDLNGWVESYRRVYTGKNELRISEKNIRKYLEDLSTGIDIPSVNAKLEISDEKITEFAPAQAGRILNVPKTLSNIVSALADNSDSSTGKISSRAAIDEIKPDVATPEEIRNLGIKTLLGRGESNFAGSPNPRINNIRVASKLFNGVLIKPGKEFSFTTLLGSVDATGGYQPELVIKKGMLIPEYGGGICQVSTTLFRAIMAVGLPVLERHPHSLPVRYYNPQGFDATVYPGVADLRFKNDTAAHILIQSKIVGSKIYFEIYGTNDKREVKIDGPHQYDIGSNGSLKARLTRTVIYPDGTKKEDDFKSSYQSPSLFPTIRNPLE